MRDVEGWPPAYRAAWNEPRLERRGWARGLAPQLIGLFLWVAYFDQIPAEALSPGRILAPILGAGVAGLLCDRLLFRVPATWGMATGRGLPVVASATFGVRGATWIPGLLLAGAQVVWLAVALDYGTSLSLRGLELLQLLSPRYSQPLPVGGFNVPGVLFLVTSMLWGLAAAFVGRYLVRVIAALMNVYPILPALMLGLTTVLALKGIGRFSAAGPAGLTPAGAWVGGWAAAAVTVQMVFGFFATAGLNSADLGTVARGPSDVKLGGLVGVMGASWVVATLALLSAAGAIGRSLDAGGPTAHATGGIRYVAALESLAGPRLAGGMLLAFGLAALAPACYAAFQFSTRQAEAFPRVSRTRWTLVAALVAWALVAARAVERLYDVFSIVGGLLAPVAGAMAADYVRSKGLWPGSRKGFNGPGLLAWALGSVVGLTPTLARFTGSTRLGAIEPAAVLAFGCAFAIYYLAAALGTESPPALEEPEPTAPAG
jgi:cytosine permease